MSCEYHFTEDQRKGWKKYTLPIPWIPSLLSQDVDKWCAFTTLIFLTLSINYGRPQRRQSDHYRQRTQTHHQKIRPPELYRAYRLSGQSSCSSGYRSNQAALPCPSAHVPELCAYFLFDNENFVKKCAKDGIFLSKPDVNQFFDLFYHTGFGFKDELNLPEKLKRYNNYPESVATYHKLQPAERIADHLQASKKENKN